MKKYRCTIHLDHGFGKSGTGYVVFGDDSMEIYNYWNKRRIVLDVSQIQKIVQSEFLWSKIYYNINGPKVMNLELTYHKEIRSVAQRIGIIVEKRGLRSFIKERNSFIAGIIEYNKYWLI